MKQNVLKKIFFIFGTRPEAIKLAPLIKEFQKHKNKFIVEICITGQHKEMLNQVMTFFNLKSDYNLRIMVPNQTLSNITAESIKGLEEILKKSVPDFIFVQGDTTTAFAGALTAFYEKRKIVHIEAGLRSFNKYSPFPEEINRILIGGMANYHFAPTQNAKRNLYNEGRKKNVFVVGNTGIDALFLALQIIKKQNLENKIKQNFDFSDLKKIILVTAHRRENFGEQFENICKALKKIAKDIKDVEIIYPVHLNPNVRKPVYDILKSINNVHLIEPVTYPELIWLMNKSYLVLTDSGGIQEEAPSLGKPVLVLREVTERTEGIKAGTAKLVGTDKDKIVSTVKRLFKNKKEYLKMSKATNPYGNGKSSEKIVKVIANINDGEK